MIASRGQFRINPRWTFGWDVMAQTDNNFSRTYGISGYSENTVKSEVYLTGLSNRSYFDLRSYRFDIQDAITTNLTERQQATVHPSLDYTRTFSDPVAGGELALNVNGYSVSRNPTTSGHAPGLRRPIHCSPIATRASPATIPVSVQSSNGGGSALSRP
jgi:LPS-assembly protein